MLAYNAQQEKTLEGRHCAEMIAYCGGNRGDRAAGRSIG